MPQADGRFDAWRPQVALGLRGVLLVLVGAILGLRVLHSPTATGVGLLAGLLLIIADFHGSPGRRLRTYVAVALTSTVIIGAGAAMNGLDSAALIPIVALGGAGFTVLRVGGGMFAAAGTTLLADMLLGLAAGAGGCPPMLASAAALVGGLAATACAMLVMPSPWVSPVRKASADALASCARVLRGQSPSAELEGVGASLVRTYVARPERPATPTPAAIASVDALADIGRLADLLVECQSLHDGAAPRMAKVVECSRALLLDPGSAAAIAELDAARLSFDQLPAVTTFPDSAVRRSVAGIADSIPTVSDVGFNLRSVSMSQLRTQVTIRLSPGAAVLRTAVAAAVLFGLLAGVVRTFHIPHPQWVFLCAVSAFYPYARRAAARAGTVFAGTLLGFGVLTVLVMLLGVAGPLWWLVMVCAAWFAMSAPHTSAGTVYGQCAFTVLSLSLLSLASGAFQGRWAGERVADVLLGAAVALAVAALLAPRNLRSRLCRSLSSMLGSASHALLEPRTVDMGRVRAEFLRCADVVDVMRGVGDIATRHLVDWLDAARMCAQACAVSTMIPESELGRSVVDVAEDYAAAAAALGACDAVPSPSHAGDGPPEVVWIRTLLIRQVASLSTLSPLQSRDCLR